MAERGYGLRLNRSVTNTWGRTSFKSGVAEVESSSYAGLKALTNQECFSLAEVLALMVQMEHDWWLGVTLPCRAFPFRARRKTQSPPL